MVTRKNDQRGPKAALRNQVVTQAYERIGVRLSEPHPQEESKAIDDLAKLLKADTHGDDEPGQETEAGPWRLEWITDKDKQDRNET